MRIAFYSPTWPVERAHNGIATYVGIMKRALEKKGCECIVITARYLGDDPAEEPDVYVATRRQRKGLDKLRAKLASIAQGAARYDLGPFSQGIGDALRRAEREKPIDIFECEESFGRPYYFYDDVKTPILIRMHGPHFVVHQGDKTPFDANRIKIEGAAIAKSAAVTCPSKGVLDKAAAHYKGAMPLSRSIPNPVEIPDNDDCWSIENCDPNTLLFVGRFDLVKGADILLDAFAQLARKHPNLRLVMAGTDNGIPNGAGEFVKFTPYVEARYERDMLGRVEFIGPVNAAALAKLRRSAFACVVSSRFECFPYAVTEALALGCPVITTPTYGPAEILKNGEALLVTKKVGARELADEINNLVGDPQRAEAIGAAGRQQMIEKFSADAIASQSLAFYKEVLTRGQRSRAAS